MAALRIIFMGTPQLSCASLDALLRQPELQVLSVVTQPDKPSGRKLKLQPSPVKELALHHEIPILQPERARNEQFIGQLRALQPELIVVVAYGQILPLAILELPRFGCINVHTSLLPKYRGAAPIQWAILNDEPETGVTIMKMDQGLDTGDILTQERTRIEKEDDSAALHDRLARIGAELLIRTIPDFISGKIRPRPQPAEGVIHAPKIRKEDGRLDWTQPARVLWNKVRGLTPWPGAFTYIEGEKLLKIWKAEPLDAQGAPGLILRADNTALVVGCAHGALQILEIQREGGKRLAARDFLAGNPLLPGQLLG